MFLNFNEKISLLRMISAPWPVSNMTYWSKLGEVDEKRRIRLFNQELKK